MLVMIRILQLPQAPKIAVMLAMPEILQLPLDLWRNDESSASACKSPYVSYVKDSSTAASTENRRVLAKLKILHLPPAPKSPDVSCAADSLTAASSSSCATVGSEQYLWIQLNPRHVTSQKQTSLFNHFQAILISWDCPFNET